MSLNCVNKVSFATSGLSVKKKEEMLLRKTAAFAGVFTDSAKKQGSSALEFAGTGVASYTRGKTKF